MTDAEGGAFELGTDGPMVILVGVDNSVTSLRAGAYAAGLARRQGARLVVVYVDLRRRVDEAVAERGVPTTFIVAAGDPYHELRRVADEVRADAVVVGASTKAGHRLVGSLAVRLVKAGRWPVTVVP